MRVLDLFCGLKGWSQPFADRGHEVVTLDFDAQFEPDILRDVLTMDYDYFATWPRFDVVLASPPCNSFSVASIGKHWSGGKRAYVPKTEKTRMGLEILRTTVRMIEYASPLFWIIENPRGLMRKMEVMRNLKRRTVTYCKYGEKRMKPTDLWGGFPSSLQLHPICKNSDPCHVRAPRGSRTGTQGMDRAESAKIPYALALAVCEACERDLGMRDRRRA